MRKDISKKTLIGRQIVQLALPDHLSLPTKFSKSEDVPPISCNISSSLDCPEALISPRRGAPPFAIVHVPEAAVHKDNPLELGQNNIGRAREIRPVKTKAKPHSVEHGTD